MNHAAPLIAAAVPTAIYTLVLWWLDRYEKEPFHLLAVTFIWGALPALGLALVAELALGNAAALLFGPSTQTTILAPLVEEPLKAFVLIGIFVFARREFNGVLDGVIYGALVGFGFAMSENILYLISYGDQFVSIWLLRTIAFGFNHAFFTSIVGIALGLVRYERRRWVGYVATPIALALAILLHALHNASAQLGFVGLGLAWIVDNGGVIVVLATVVLSQRQEHHWIMSELGDEVARGVISEEHYQRAQHTGMRSRAEVAALMSSGWLRFRRTRRFHHLLTELAFIKHQLRHRDRFCCEDDVENVRTAVVAMRRILEPAGSSVGASG